MELIRANYRFLFNTETGIFADYSAVYPSFSEFEEEVVNIEVYLRTGYGDKVLQLVAYNDDPNGNHFEYRHLIDLDRVICVSVSTDIIKKEKPL